ncbi:hypothetical protein J6590_007997 [Homalodisca vitripennis]|nr:hypothetical protein J6590_007997 [Homalodisca vitripennis]
MGTWRVTGELENQKLIRQRFAVGETRRDTILPVGRVRDDLGSQKPIRYRVAFCEAWREQCCQLDGMPV